MRRLFREPLLHFLVGGALLFLLYEFVSDDPTALQERVVVDEERVASLAASFQRTWMRPPTKGELDALVQGFVDEEILYRESLALGLDRDDLVIRRRLRQKMEFLHTELAEREAPSDRELSEYLAANREQFIEPERLSFRHVFVSPDAGSDEARRRSKEFLQMLRAGSSEIDVAGDSTLLPETMRKASERDISAVFGEGFAMDVLAMASDGWNGPIASNYGLHLVRIDERLAAQSFELEQIRRVVEREYENAQRIESNQRFLQELRERYEVKISVPSVDGAPQLTSLGF